MVSRIFEWVCDYCHYCPRKKLKQTYGLPQGWKLTLKNKKIAHICPICQSIENNAVYLEE